jgi:hypothetical protein
LRGKEKALWRVHADNAADKLLQPTERDHLTDLRELTYMSALPESRSPN